MSVLKCFKSYFKNGKLRSEVWYFQGKRHNPHGPAVRVYFANGSLHWECWYRSGKRHRIDGPAYLEYWSDNSYREEWFLDGMRHRMDGPSYIHQVMQPAHYRVQSFSLYNVAVSEETLWRLVATDELSMLVGLVEIAGQKPKSPRVMNNLLRHIALIDKQVAKNLNVTLKLS